MLHAGVAIMPTSSTADPVCRCCCLVCNVQVEVQQRLAAFAAVLASSLSDSEGRVAAHEPLPRLAVSFVAVNLKVSLTLRLQVLHCVLREWSVVLGGVLCVGATGVLCVANGVSHMSCQMPNVQDSSIASRCCDCLESIFCPVSKSIGTFVVVAWVVVGLVLVATDVNPLLHTLRGRCAQRLCSEVKT